MGYIIIWHGKNGKLCKAPLNTLYHSCPFIERCKITVEIGRISLSAGHFSPGHTQLSQRFAVTCHICHDHKNMHSQIKGEIFRCSKGKTRSGKPLYNRIIGKVQEHYYISRLAFSGQLIGEKCSIVMLYPYSCKDHRKVLFSYKSGLGSYLYRKLIMRQPVPGENRKLLSPDKGSQDICYGNTSMDKVPGIKPCHGING